MTLEDFGKISIHALLAESDQAGGAVCSALPTFLSTLSLRRATVYRQIFCHWFSISIHALLAESDVKGKLFRFIFKISIHALLAESDSAALVVLKQMRYMLPFQCKDMYQALLCGAFSLPVTAPGRLQNRIQACFLAVYGGEIHIHTCFNQ